MGSQNSPEATSGAGNRQHDAETRPSWPVIPETPTALIGRDLEVGVLLDLLRDPSIQVVTLTGAGGTGKTRLALEVAERLAETHDIAMVTLETTRDPDSVIAAILQRFGVELARFSDSEASLRETLGNESGIIVLDNYEHLLPSTAPVDTLLRTCPGLTLLITSRIRLGLAEEHVIPIHPLAYPDPNDAFDADDVARLGAVRLFIERVNAVQPAFSPVGRSMQAVATICQRLDGLPLAIELAAARAAVVSVESLAERLVERLPLLSGGDDRPRRQRTMRATIAWSVDLLSEDDRHLWETLGIFSGGFTLDAAEAVAQACGIRSDIIEAVERFVAWNLLLRGANTNGEPRFEMLGTTREYARERLAKRGDSESVRAAHAAFFHAFALTAGPEIMGRDGWAWAYRVQADLPNIRLALTWFEDQRDVHKALEMLVEIEWFWTIPGYLPEGRARYKELLNRAESTVPAALRARGWMALGDLADWQGDRAGAGDALRHALNLAREGDDPALTASILRSLGSVYIDLNRGTEAGQFLREACALATDIGQFWDAAASSNLLGINLRLQGQTAEAHQWHRKALELWQRIGDQDHVPVVLTAIGWTWLHDGEYQRAFESLDAALALTHRDEDGNNTATTLIGIAEVAMCYDQHDTAVRLLSAADKQGRTRGMPQRPAIQARAERIHDELSTALGSAKFAIAWAAGEGMTVCHAKALARAVALPPSFSGDGLSAREREVLHVLVEGASDQEIADRLYISRRTASKHVAAILEKLGATNRTAASTIAHRRGLV